VATEPSLPALAFAGQKVRIHPFPVSEFRRSSRMALTSALNCLPLRRGQERPRQRTCNEHCPVSCHRHTARGIEKRRQSSPVSPRARQAYARQRLHHACGEVYSSQAIISRVSHEQRARRAAAVGQLLTCCIQTARWGVRRRCRRVEQRAAGDAVRDTSHASTSERASRHCAHEVAVKAHPARQVACG